jgi:hypothetical protein
MRDHPAHNIPLLGAAWAARLTEFNIRWGQLYTHYTQLLEQLKFTNKVQNLVRYRVAAGGTHALDKYIVDTDPVLCAPRLMMISGQCFPSFEVFFKSDKTFFVNSHQFHLYSAIEGSDM